MPVTRSLTAAEVTEAYERHTGLVIVETFAAAAISPAEITAVLVANHGPFSWGDDAHDSVERSLVLEQLAHMDASLPPPAKEFWDTTGQPLFTDYVTALRA